MKLKGIELIKGSYKLKIRENYIVVYDEEDREIYYEHNDGFWEKKEYNENIFPSFLEDSDGYWAKWEFDEKGNIIYYENSDDYWFKKEFDENNNEIYFEDSDGDINDKRVKELTIKEIEKLLGYKIKIKGE